MTGLLAAPDLTRAITDYAKRFHAELPSAGAEHHVASPLGAWLLLALAGTAATGQTRSELERALGTDIDAAAKTAQVLLDNPHPAVASAAAVWYRHETDRLREWANDLPRSVELGPVPTQQQADAWASDKTLGLIEQFPLKMDPSVLLVLATALATKVSWTTPFRTTSAEALAGSSWSDVKNLLLTPEKGAHRMAIVATETIGDVAAHTAFAREGLAVTSVAADRDAPATDVIAAAHSIAVATATGEALPTRSLFDLPLGDAALWRITERHTETAHREKFLAILPAWTAQSEHELFNGPGLGFRQLIPIFDDLVGPGPAEGVQTALARYTREGFEAAAVTSAARMASAIRTQEQMQRIAELHFSHPYAAVAVATSQTDNAWQGVPVFSAWVAKAAETQE